MRRMQGKGFGVGWELGKRREKVRERERERSDMEERLVVETVINLKDT